MSSIKIAGIAAVVLLAAGLVAMVRHGRAQPAETATFEPENMKDFKKPEPAELKKKLSSEQFAVTQQCGTEPAFRNASSAAITEHSEVRSDFGFNQRRWSNAESTNSARSGFCTTRD